MDKTIWWIIGAAVVILLLLLLVARLRRRPAPERSVPDATPSPRSEVGPGQPERAAREQRGEPERSSPFSEPAPESPAPESRAPESPAPVSPAPESPAPAVVDAPDAGAAVGESDAHADAAPTTDVPLTPDAGPAHDPEPAPAPTPTDGAVVDPDRDFFGADDDVRSPADSAVPTTAPSADDAAVDASERSLEHPDAVVVVDRAAVDEPDPTPGDPAQSSSVDAVLATDVVSDGAPEAEPAETDIAPRPDTVHGDTAVEETAPTDTTPVDAAPAETVPNTTVTSDTTSAADPWERAPISAVGGAANEQDAAPTAADLPGSRLDPQQPVLSDVEPHESASGPSTQDRAPIESEPAPQPAGTAPEAPLEAAQESTPSTAPADRPVTDAQTDIATDTAPVDTDSPTEPEPELEPGPEPGVETDTVTDSEPVVTAGGADTAPGVTRSSSRPGTPGVAEQNDDFAGALDRLNDVRHRVQDEVSQRWTRPDATGQTPKDKVENLRGRVGDDLREGLKRFRNRGGTGN